MRQANSSFSLKAKLENESAIPFSNAMRMNDRLLKVSDHTLGENGLFGHKSLSFNVEGQI
jgi:hypothetical protein